MTCATCYGGGHEAADHDTADAAFATVRAELQRIWFRYALRPPHKRKPGTADEGEGQHCYVCGTELKARRWETVRIGTHHRMVCAGRWSLLCGRRQNWKTN